MLKVLDGVLSGVARHGVYILLLSSPFLSFAHAEGKRGESLHMASKIVFTSGPGETGAREEGQDKVRLI